MARLGRSLWLRALVTVGVLGFLLARIDPGATLESLLRLRLPHAAAVLALLALDRVVMIWRWVLLLRAAGTPASTGAMARIYLISSFVGGFLPSGVGADVARAYSLTRHTAQSSEAVASVALDRLMGLLSLVVMGALGIGVWAPRLEPGVRSALLLAAGLSLAAGAALFWADYWLRAAIPAHWRPAAPADRLLRLGAALARYRSRGATVVIVFALSAGVQLLRILQAYLLGLGLGIRVVFAYYLFFMPIGLLVLLLPVSISGFGLPQGVIVWLLRPQGVADPEALALSTLIVLSGVIANLPGAWLYLRSKPAAADTREGSTRAVLSRHEHE